jgi:hypothetical protein
MEIGSLSPSLQGGEGPDRGVLSRYIDLKNRVVLRFEKHGDRLPFPLSPVGEGWGEGMDFSITENPA